MLTKLPHQHSQLLNIHPLAESSLAQQFIFPFNYSNDITKDLLILLIYLACFYIRPVELIVAVMKVEATGTSCICYQFSVLALCCHAPNRMVMGKEQ
jgi:hypothetical protein